MTRLVKDIYSQLKLDEGEKLQAYQDHLGFWTIGVGRLIDGRKGGGITPAESQFLLDNDVSRRKQALKTRLPWAEALSAPRYGVLLNMSFQLGVDGLVAFTTTLAHVRAGRYDDAAVAMLQSLWAQQTPERAHRLAEQMRTDAWQ